MHVVFVKVYPFSNVRKKGNANCISWCWTAQVGCFSCSNTHQYCHKTTWYCAIIVLFICEWNVRERHFTVVVACEMFNGIYFSCNLMTRNNLHGPQKHKVMLKDIWLGIRHKADISLFTDSPPKLPCYSASLLYLFSIIFNHNTCIIFQKLTHTNVILKKDILFQKVIKDPSIIFKLFYLTIIYNLHLEI